MPAGDVIEEAPAGHGLAPEAVLEARLMQTGPGAFEDVPILPLDDAVGGGAIISRRIMAPPKILCSLQELSGVIGIEELGVAGTSEISKNCTSSVGVFRRTWTGFQPHSSPVVAVDDEAPVVVALVPLVQDHMIGSDKVAELDWRIRVRMILLSDPRGSCSRSLRELTRSASRMDRKVGQIVLTRRPLN